MHKYLLDATAVASIQTLHLEHPRETYRLPALLLALGLGLAANTLLAGTFTWTGAGSDQNWNTPANWGGSVPGTKDTATFVGPSNGLAANATVMLGANQTIATLNLNESNTNVTFGGDGGYSLTFTNLGGAGANWPNIAAPVILSGPGTFGWGSGQWNYNIRFLQPISDGGNNYGLTLGVTPMNYLFSGKNTYGGTTVVSSLGLNLTGANGSLTNTTINLSCRNSYGTTLMLDNTTTVNNDRLGDNQPILTSYFGGSLLDYGASLAATEQVGTVSINSGFFQLSSSTSGGSNPNVMLWLAGVNRAPGTAMGLCLTSEGHGSLGVNNATNVNGVWQPWAFASVDYPYTVDFVKVTANTNLAAFGDADYAYFPTSGASSTVVYRITNSTPVSLAASESVYALAGNANSASNVTLQLGNYDLTITSGALIGREGGLPNISSAGGRLLFGGNEIILGVRYEVQFDAKNASVSTFDCPIGCLGTGAKNLVIGCVRTTPGSNLTFRLIGNDLNGTYNTIFCPWGYGNSYAIIELGGSSNRTITGALNGIFNLVKSGAGTSGSKSRILRAVVALVRAANISRSASILTREKRIFLRPPFFVAHNG